MNGAKPAELPRVLGTFDLWGVAVGLVISGDYFGWNYGLNATSAFGLLLALAIVSVMYITMVFGFTELSTSIPNAGGPYAYAEAALGPWFGVLTGAATLVEFLFAPPAIAFAIGSYLHLRIPSIEPKAGAIGVLVLFAAVHAWGIRLSATIELVATLLAVLELIVFCGVTAPHVKMSMILTKPLLPNGLSGLAGAFPFAIWFYLGLEGLAMSAEEAKDPGKTLKRGYLYGLVTLVVLAFATLICTVGILPSSELIKDDSPLPKALAQVTRPDHWLTHMMVYLGLFGLIASFHGILLGASRQVFALARAGYLPHPFGKLHPTRKTPILATVAAASVGAIVIQWGKTEQAITLSVIGALLMYALALVSLVVLRKRKPEMTRPFRAPFHPWSTWLSIALVVVMLVGSVMRNSHIAGLAAAMVLALSSICLGWKNISQRAPP